MPPSAGGTALQELPRRSSPALGVRPAPSPRKPPSRPGSSGRGSSPRARAVVPERAATNTSAPACVRTTRPLEGPHATASTDAVSAIRYVPVCRRRVPDRPRLPGPRLLRSEELRRRHHVHAPDRLERDALGLNHQSLDAVLVRSPPSERSSGPGKRLTPWQLRRGFPGLRRVSVLGRHRLQLHVLLCAVPHHVDDPL